MHSAFGTQSEGGRVCFQFPYHCFHFLTVPDLCWCNVQEAEVKGKLRLEGSLAITLFLSLPPLFHSHWSSCSRFYPNTHREKLMTWWGESAKLGKNKQRNRAWHRKTSHFQAVTSAHNHVLGDLSAHMDVRGISQRKHHSSKRHCQRHFWQLFTLRFLPLIYRV